MANLNKLFVVSSQQTTKNPYKFEGYKLHHCCNLESILSDENPETGPIQAKGPSGEGRRPKWRRTKLPSGEG